MTAVDLSGQVAVVTGGGRGIGREIAAALARAGAAVAVTGRSAAHLDEAVAAMRDAGGTAAAFPMDVTDAQQVSTTFAAISEQLGAVDILVNNAGIAGAGLDMFDVSAEDWWRVMDVNVRGVLLCSQAVLSPMRERGAGCIINLGSYAGFYPADMASAYSVSKAALVRLGENIAEAGKDHGISVFTISPGLVLTDMTRDVPIFEDVPPDQWTPIERAGEVCVRLASGEADMLSGRFIHVSDDDLDALIARADEIVENDWQSMRLRRMADAE